MKFQCKEKKTFIYEGIPITVKVLKIRGEWQERFFTYPSPKGFNGSCGGSGGKTFAEWFNAIGSTLTLLNRKETMFSASAGLNSLLNFAGSSDKTAVCRRWDW